jgi:hypothetical protein
MKSFSPILFFALAAVFTSCAKPPELYTICFRSSKNVILATGTMEIRAPLHPEVKARGKYTLKFHDVPRDKTEVEWFLRLIGKGEEAVEWSTQSNQPEAWRNTFDFNPGHYDANITARVPGLNSGQATGIWSYAIGAGGFHGGTLELKIR